MKPGRSLLTLALLVWAMPLAAQDAAAGQTCVVFPVKDLSPGTETRDYEQTITEAVSAAFSGAGFQVVPPASWQGAAASRSVDPARPIGEEDALAVARSVGAGLAVTGVYSVHAEEIYYSIQGWNVSAGTLAAAVQATTPFNLAFFSELNISLVSRLLPRLQPHAAAGPRVVLTSPDEGMRVKLSDDQDVGRITDGRLAFPGTFPPGTKVLLAKSKPGYHSGEQTVTLTAAKPVSLSPLVPEYRHGLELQSTIGQLLGVGVALRDYRVPDWFFLSLGGYLWVQPPLNFAPRAVLHTDMNVGLGGYLFLKPDAPVRLGVSTGGGLVLSFLTTPGFPIYTDFYLDVMSWWLEARLFGTTFFIRQDYKYALGVGTNLLGQGMLVQGLPPTTLGVLFRW